jgi:hypothetical protein
VATLRADAARTRTAEDDAIVKAISAAREQQDAIEPDVAELRSEHGAALARLKDVQKLRREFRHRGYDSSNSVFDAGFDWKNLLGGLVGGALVFGDVWSTFNRNQSFRRSRRRGSNGANLAMGILGGLLSSAMSSGSRGSSSSSGFGFGGGGGFGGFSSGGGFGGGGGFSTGGGFGGGGGFTTTGGF